MAGHSKWSKIRHAKGIADAKKGKVFSKLAQQISIAVREGGGDVDTNPSLRVLVDKAKAEGLPAANIQRAINKGLGIGQDGAKFEECVYEGIGPGGVSMILDVTTDNTNRVVSDLRRLFVDFGGNLSDSGSQSWNFDQKGRVEVKCGKMQAAEKHGKEDVFAKEPKDDVMMQLMDIPGIVDIEDVDDETLNVITGVQDLHSVKEVIKGLGYVIPNYELIRIPKMLRDISDEDKEKLSAFVSSLEEYTDIQGIWFDTNL